MISEMLLGPDLSLGVFWLVILDPEVRFGEALDLRRSQQPLTSSCGERHQSEFTDHDFLRGWNDERLNLQGGLAPALPRIYL